MHEIGTFPSGACHSGRKQLQSVFLGPFLENNGPVWHSRRPVGPFWLTFGIWWALGILGDQACRNATFANTKWPTLGHQGPETCKSPTYLATSTWQDTMGPSNAHCKALGLAPKFGRLDTLHIPQQFPLSCPTLRRRHTLPRHKDGKTNQNAAPPHCGGPAWLWFGALDHNMAGVRGTEKMGKCH